MERNENLLHFLLLPDFSLVSFSLIYTSPAKHISLQLNMFSNSDINVSTDSSVQLLGQEREKMCVNDWNDVEKSRSERNIVLRFLIDINDSGSICAIFFW